jgi:hypothetical protein
MARLVVEIDDGRHAAAAPLTFGELLDRRILCTTVAAPIR